jgi:enterobactin synthetase component D
MTAGPAALHPSLESELQAWLGSGVAVVCTGVNGDPAGLWPEEIDAVARAVPRRRCEFAAGRSAARAAMQRLGRPAVAIPAQADRSPRWPDGLVGSIAHCADVCVAVVGWRTEWESIGVDIEPDRGIDEPLWNIICTADEQRRLEAPGSLGKAARVTRVFCAKEAFYKWHYPLHQTFLDFHEVSVNWGSDGSGFQVVAGASRAPRRADPGRGHLFSRGGHVLACYASRAGQTGEPVRAAAPR